MREECYVVFPDRFHYKDHPRACGKNAVVADKSTCPLGSPPRMREECIERSFYAM